MAGVAVGLPMIVPGMAGVVNGRVKITTALDSWCPMQCGSCLQVTDGIVSILASGHLAGFFVWAPATRLTYPKALYSLLEGWASRAGTLKLSQIPAVETCVRELILGRILWRFLCREPTRPAHFLHLFPVTHN